MSKTIRCWMGVLLVSWLLVPGGATETRPVASEQVPAATNLQNPAAVYCTEMGYRYQVTGNGDAQAGVCTLPDGEACEAWGFLAGRCGAAYSFCAQQGYGIETRSDGQDAFSREYAVCLNSDGSAAGPVSELFDLATRSVGCAGQAQPAEERPESSGRVTYQPPVTAPPASFDWRSYNGYNWLTPVRDQGMCGSCWAFAAVGASEAAHNIAADNPNLDKDLSEQYLVSDCHEYGGYQNCCGGWDDIALQYIRDTGIPDEACLAYVDGTGCSCDGSTCDTNCTYRTASKCSDRTCSDRCSDWSSRLTQIVATGYVGADPTTIKQALVDMGPLSVSLGYGSAFGGYWDGDIYRCTSDTGLNHAVVLAGYDDAGGYWWIKNSWGSGWGEAGYFKLGYGECQVEQYVYYADARPPNSAPNTPSSPVPATGATGQSIDVNTGWTGGDPDSGDTVTYDVYFEANDATPDVLVCNDVTGTECEPGTLAYSTLYYWYVVAADNHGGSATGPTWSLTTQAGTPAVGPVVHQAHVINDDNDRQSLGNGDGIANCGETIEMWVALLNQGAGRANTVRAAASTASPYVTWAGNSSSGYPNIGGGAIRRNYNDFEFLVAPGTPNGTVIHFTLNVTAGNGGPWGSGFDVVVTCTP